jgi:hypothetical protein
MNHPISIMEYTDPVAFLRDRLLESKLTHRQFSAHLGLKSPATLNHILSGRRRIVEKREVRDSQHKMVRDSWGQIVYEDCVPIYGKILKLNSLETEYFRLLLRHEYAENSQEKSQIQAEMSQLKEEMLRAESQWLPESGWGQETQKESFTLQVSEEMYQELTRRLAELRSWVLHSALPKESVDRVLQISMLSVPVESFASTAS